MIDTVPITRALISVSDKTGLTVFAQALREHKIEILSTGGTYKALCDANIPVTEVSTHTGFPEMMDGRVKTLHPRIHGGILARRDSHAAALRDHDIPPIDLVIVNLYPFEATVAADRPFEDCIENIDIGGPALIRSASKNHDFVTVVVDPSDYEMVMAELVLNQGATTLETRRSLAAKAFARTAAYDAAISGWFASQLGETFPQRYTMSGTLQQTMRYGENPHQNAALYRDNTGRPGVASAQQLQGKELSYNNLADADAALEQVAEFERPAVAIIKHANPCGVAEGGNLAEAYARALACDPVSAFGGIIAVNQELDAETAEQIAKLFAEVIVAPSISAGAREVLGAKKNLRVLATGKLPDPAASGLVVKTIAGGFLLQSRDTGRIAADELKVVTKRAPTDKEREDLLFAFRVAKHVKSNAIVYAKDRATVGVGAGQMSRVDSSRIAAWKAAEAAGAAGLPEPLTRGSVVASDAFFPFPDGLIAAAEAGVTAVIQPGGSVRDQDVIAAADERGLAMVFTGIRHFRH
ncbi:MAG TPA: bifunctional phosphoribosylaminoimidazolecarboxamide formyltransferase/IMP cyclohydrolase [Alphaproteobacteria bacterium]|nr:bifunctional phosphoribosylaminoimidazolecarboxamide formyltransferase/IMP cyclohydrolase [Alphaproteobacteria bacterium]